MPLGHFGSSATTIRYDTIRLADGSYALSVVGISECCRCEQPTEDYVLCPRCGSVKR